MATIEQAVSGGISFALTEEQKALRQLAREFAEKEIRPKAAEYDEHSTHPADVIAKAHELGLMNLHVPESLGGLALCAFGLTEPDAGSDVARMKTTAVRRGDEYVLNGSKTFITNAGHAAWTVVFAKTDASKGHRGISAFIVPMDAPGVTIEKHLDKMGQR